MDVLIRNVSVPLDDMLLGRERALQRTVAHAIGVKPARLGDVHVVRKSVDARKKADVHFVCNVRVALDGIDNAEGLVRLRLARGVQVAKWVEPARIDVPVCATPAEDARPLVVGAGPAGLFAALTLARAGLRPIVVERGRDVDARTVDVKRFNAAGELDVNSNIQFGEGGAGTFSDGKLTTGTKSPHIQAVLQDFIDAGAPDDILVDAHPHIGTDYLPTVVKNLRNRIIALGGEVRFNTQFVNFAEGEDAGTAARVTSLAAAVAADGSRGHLPHAVCLRDLLDGREYVQPCSEVVLAIGHSARDTFETLAASGVAMERKPFAVGARIEHLQRDIDKAQYGRAAGHLALPPAEYKLATHNLDGRGVYTFCMCPGGDVVAAASEAGGVCTNGMSNHARDGRNANSALLVEVRPDDLPGDDVLAGMYLQRDVERRAYAVAQETAEKYGKTAGEYAAPAQTVGDFLREGQGACNLSAADAVAAARDVVESSGLPATDAWGAVAPTYPRGAVPASLRDVLPGFVCDAMAEALPALDKKLHGFADPGAVLTAPEARSSSPVRIIRNKDNLQMLDNPNVYPAGEGAGYAGGIMSAACDGMRVALAIIELRLAAVNFENAEGGTDVAGQ